jgi:predicted AAA+ superfamily ATPase
MILKRDIAQTLKRFSKFPVVALLGPRQSGKTTLAKNHFKKHRYINLEDLEAREFVKNDPKRFLRENENEHGIIIDEFQYVPEFLSYVQIESDEKKRPGYFILTGSQNFLMNQAITQSLAGRVGILTLLPLSINELAENNFLPEVDKAIFSGGYPRLYAENFAPTELYPAYIYSYIERDVHQLIKTVDLLVFRKFMQLCAGRTGQLLNIADIAANCGVNQKVINQWLAVLEASYIIFLLKPYFNNFNKRIVKAPKLYFYDTGVACSLLEIRNENDLSKSSFRGSLFENLIISDLHKQYYNAGSRPPLYFWRDTNDRVEVDCLIDKGIKLLALEVKSGETISNSFFDALEKWNEIADTSKEDNYLIYAGPLVQRRTPAQIIGWKKVGNLVEKIEK